LLPLEPHCLNGAIDPKGEQTLPNTGTVRAR